MRHALGVIVVPFVILFLPMPSASQCHKWEAGLFYAIPSGHASTTNSARASFATRNVKAPNTKFTLVAVQVATGDKAPPTADPSGLVPTNPYQGGGMVEVGQHAGTLLLAGQGSLTGNYYFTFRLDPSTLVAEAKPFLNGQGTPMQWSATQGSQYFAAGSCEASPPPASVCQSQPATTAWACIKNNGACERWVNHGPVGTRFFVLAIEASCGDDLAGTYVAKHYLNPIQFRSGANWVNVTSPLPFKGLTVRTPSGPTSPPGGPDFDLRLCNPSQANKVIGWLHDDQTNPGCN